jgi:hypothetical protein
VDKGAQLKPTDQPSTESEMVFKVCPTLANILQRGGLQGPNQRSLPLDRSNPERMNVHALTPK